MSIMKNKELVTYFYLSSPSSFTLSTKNTTKNWDGTLYYSTNNSTWSEWTGTTTISSRYINNEYRLYLRGVNNTYIVGSNTTNKGWSLNGSNISLNGNIENLLDYILVKNNEHPLMASYCFCRLFYECTALIKLSEDLLSAKVLASYCYSNMFYGCTSLTSIPENLLPAKILTSYCYNYMFYKCTNLTSIPENLLPAIKLASYCYSNMFYGCTSLTSIPENLLPAKILLPDCYANMFNGCTSLTSIPKNLLPATKLASYCYS